MAKSAVEAAEVPRFNQAAPYSTAVRAGEFLFITGQVATDRDGAIVGVGDIREQVRQTLRNIEAILAAAGGGCDDIVRMTYFYMDIDDVAKLGGVREEFMTPPFPAATGVQVARLADPRLLVEIEATAWLP